jgi:hypothetical protein
MIYLFSEQIYWAKKYRYWIVLFFVSSWLINHDVFDSNPVEVESAIDVAKRWMLSLVYFVIRSAGYLLYVLLIVFFAFIVHDVFSAFSQEDIVYQNNEDDQHVLSDDKKMFSWQGVVILALVISVTLSLADITFLELYESIDRIFSDSETDEILDILNDDDYYRR